MCRWFDSAPGHQKLHVQRCVLSRTFKGRYFKKMRLFFRPGNLSFPANAIDARQEFSRLGFRHNLGILCLQIEQIRLVWPASRSPASRGLGRRCLGRSACTRCKLGRARSRPRIGEGKRCARLRCRLRCQWHAGCCQDRCVSRKNPHDTRRVTAVRSHPKSNHNGRVARPRQDCRRRSRRSGKTRTPQDMRYRGR